MVVPDPVEPLPDPLHGALSSDTLPAQVLSRAVQRRRSNPLGAVERPLYHQPPVRCHPEAIWIHSNPDIRLDPDPGALPGTHLGIRILGGHGGG